MQLQPKNLLSNLLSTRHVFLDSDKNIYLVLGTKEEERVLSKIQRNVFEDITLILKLFLPMLYQSSFQFGFLKNTSLEIVSKFHF